MNHRIVTSLVFGMALATGAYAQDANPAPPDNQNPAMDGGMRLGGGTGQRGRGQISMMGRGVSGTVTEVTASSYSIKTFRGENYTVHFSANTRIMKQPAGAGGRRGMGGGMRMGGNPPEPIKATEIKVGDAIAAMGEVDAAAKSVGAMGIVLLDPERAKQMQQMEADYGKTWLMGKVTAIDGVKVTLTGAIDDAPHTFVADENTTFRKRRNPITLADIHVGDMVRAEGAIKDGAFTAAAVNVMPAPGEAPRVPRDAPPQQ